MYKGKIKGFFCDGPNPAVGGPNAKLARAAMQKLDWLVVVDIFNTETAEVWKAPGTNSKDVKTEVFLDRKSTRLNSSHSQISYAVFCLKKKKKDINYSTVCTSKK